MNSTEQVGRTVHMIRRSAGLTMEDLSRIAGVSVSYLSQVERGKKNPSQSWTHNLLGAVGQHLLLQDQQNKEAA